jgi:hypothetical protein
VATTHASSSTTASGSSQAMLGASSKSATTRRQGRAVAHSVEQLSVQRVAIPSKLEMRWPGTHDSLGSMAS